MDIITIPNPTIVPVDPYKKRIEEINSWETAHKYILVPDDPNQTITNICSHGVRTYCYDKDGRPVEHTPDNAFIRVIMENLFDTFYWDTLFGDKKKWYRLCVNRLRHMVGQRRGNVTPSDVQLCLCEGMVRLYVSESELWLRVFKQKIKRLEVAYVLKKLTHKILQDCYRHQYEYSTIAHNYFLGDNEYARTFRTQFRAKTGRVLNKHKMVLISDVLNKHELIIKERRRTDKWTFAALRYTIGPKNPYRRKAMQLLESST